MCSSNEIKTDGGVCCTAWMQDADDRHQASIFYGNIGDELIFICPPYWCSEMVPQGRALLLIKNMYGTLQAARQRIQRISGWMEEHSYMSVNNEKTMLNKWEGSDFILHGLFVDDMARTSTSQRLL